MDFSNLPDFTFCDNETELEAVVESLRGSSILFLDCEGVNLGVKGGRLAVISLGTASPQSVYLIDAITLSPPALRPVFDILESGAVQKVVFDGRMDQSALFHEHHVTMQNVVDLQLADIQSRRLRGEKEGSAEQLERLSPYLYHNEVESNFKLYERVHKLAGLGGALTEHRREDPDDPELTLKALPVGAAIDWAERPIPRLGLAYAANDVRLISRLHGHFEKAGFLDADLPAQSTRYIAMWNSGGPPKNADTYKGHALLPLGIIDAVSAHQQTQRCTGCQRFLSSDCFSKAAWNKAKDRKCLVCRAIGIRDLRKKQIRETIESDYDAVYYESD